jgi:hypothetical protein
LSSSSTPPRSRRISRTSSALLVALTAGAVFALVLTPPAKRWLPGPSDDQVRYRIEKARADDLDRQNKALTAKLEKGRPPASDRVALARASDLKRQVQMMEAKLRLPPPDSQEARAADLKRQVEELEAKVARPRSDTDGARAEDLLERLRRAEELLRRPRPDPGDPEAVARAEDLKRQVDALTEQLSRPRPEPDPLAGVTADKTRAQITAADHLFGLYTEQAPFDYGEVDLVQGTVQREADLIGYFQSWTEDFRPDAVKQAWKRGQIPFLTWEPQSRVGAVTAIAPEFSLPTIINGGHDDYVRRYAKAIADTGLPIIMRFAHEMNGTWYPWSEVQGWDGASINGNHRGDFVKAWRHVHQLFEEEGANDYTVWLWSPNRINRIPSQPDPAAFYPGDAFVDWVGMSGYHRDYDEAATFDDTYGRTLPLLRVAGPDKPIFLSEIGATEADNRKAQWIDSLFAGLDANPDIIGFAWFNLVVTMTVDDVRRTNDWRINSSREPIESMAKGLATHEVGQPMEPLQE